MIISRMRSFEDFPPVERSVIGVERGRHHVAELSNVIGAERQAEIVGHGANLLRSR